MRLPQLVSQPFRRSRCAPSCRGQLSGLRGDVAREEIRVFAIFMPTILELNPKQSARARCKNWPLFLSSQSTRLTPPLLNPSRWINLASPPPRLTLEPANLGVPEANVRRGRGVFTCALIHLLGLRMGCSSK